MTTDPPDHVRAAYSDWAWEEAWAYEGRVTTWRLTAPNGTNRFLKVASSDETVRLTAEAAAMRWAIAYIRVPEVIDAGTTDNVDWLISNEIPGQPAFRDDWRVQPDWLVPIVAGGLRRFHDQLPVDECPFRLTIPDALAICRGRIDSGREMFEDLHDVHKHMSVEEAYDRLVSLAPSTEDLVVCHGDYCFPNVMIEQDEVTGYLDLGELAVADRWWDVAIGMWSTTWNVGLGYEEMFAASYGIDVDDERLAFYRLLYDLIS